MEATEDILPVGGSYNDGDDAPTGTCFADDDDAPMTRDEIDLEDRENNEPGCGVSSPLPHGPLQKKTSGETKKDDRTVGTTESRRRRQILLLCVGLAAVCLVAIIVVPLVTIRPWEYKYRICGSPDDPCMNEDNYATCRSIVDIIDPRKKPHQDTCEEIDLMGARCPFRFECGCIERCHSGEEPYHGMSLTEVYDICGRLSGNDDDPCESVENWLRCAELVDFGCDRIRVHETACPRRYTCEDYIGERRYDACGEPCDDAHAWYECRHLVDSGCTQVYPIYP